MLSNFPQRARTEAFREIEYCIPIFSIKVYSVSMRYPKLMRPFKNVLKNKRTVPKRMMYLAPYFLPAMAKAVGVLLGKEKMREYETAVRIYQQFLVAYLKQDLKTLTVQKVGE